MFVRTYVSGRSVLGGGIGFVSAGPRSIPSAGSKMPHNNLASGGRARCIIGWPWLRAKRPLSTRRSTAAGRTFARRPESSDTDLRGVLIPPPLAFHGFRETRRTRSSRRLHRQAMGVPVPPGGGQLREVRPGAAPPDPDAPALAALASEGEARARELRPSERSTISQDALATSPLPAQSEMPGN